MFQIYEYQDNFLDDKHLRLDLLDIGVYGYILIGLHENMDNIITNLFKDELIKEVHEKYSLIEAIK